MKHEKPDVSVLEFIKSPVRWFVNTLRNVRNSRDTRIGINAVLWFTATMFSIVSPFGWGVLLAFGFVMGYLVWRDAKLCVWEGT